jgi:hypothetical protein
MQLKFASVLQIILLLAVVCRNYCCGSHFIFWKILVSTESIYVKFVGHNLKVSHRRHVRNC